MGQIKSNLRLKMKFFALGWLKNYSLQTQIFTQKYRSWLRFYSEFLRKKLAAGGSGLETTTILHKPQFFRKLRHFPLFWIFHIVVFSGRGLTRPNSWAKQVRDNEWGHWTLDIITFWFMRWRKVVTVIVWFTMRFDPSLICKKIVWVSAFSSTSQEYGV